jgi:hypothetical protein
MKNTIFIISALIVALVFIPGAFAKGAANGTGTSYHGQQFAERTCYDSDRAGGAQCPGTCQLIASGDPIEISGIVAEVCTEGQGLKIETGDEVISVYGIGPIRYWTEEDVARPTVGEEITVNAVEVTFSDGSTKIIATEIEVSGESIDLRDDSGLPLWRGGNSQRVQKRDCLE